MLATRNLHEAEEFHALRVQHLPESPKEESLSPRTHADLPFIEVYRETSPKPNYQRFELPLEFLAGCLDELLGLPLSWMWHGVWHKRMVLLGIVLHVRLGSHE